MFDYIKIAYAKFWDWQKNAASILMARITTLTGFVTSAISFMDWSPLWTLFGADTGFTRNQAFWLGIGLGVKGLFDEFVRRLNTTVADGTLVPTKPKAALVKNLNKKKGKKNG